MLNLRHISIKSNYDSLFLRAVFLGAACFWSQQTPVRAIGFDVGETVPSAGTGSGQDGAFNKGRTNVKFSDFGTFTPNPNPGSGGNPADLLPINQQNTVDGMNINSFKAQDFYVPGVQSGTYNQAPQVNPGQAAAGRGENPYLPGAKTLLPPVTTGLQAQYQPNAHLPIGASKFSFGFNKVALPTMYNGSYNPIPGVAPQLPTGSGFSAPGFLPPASLGSVDINVVGR